MSDQPNHQPARTWPALLTELIGRNDLDAESARWAADQILSGEVSPVQIAGFAVALRTKGETATEVGGFADAMLERAVQLELDTEAVDIVGSGGDRANTVNISTMASMVAAAAGARVVKHGNRSASSMTGSADVLEALGVAIDVPPQAHQQILEQVGITFLFAPKFHSSLRHAASARKELAVQTTFNFLGPLSNPARPKAQAIGVANRPMAATMAQVLADRGARGLVFHGQDGLDELTTTTASDLWLFQDGELVTTSLDPQDLGLAPARPQDLTGGRPDHNAQVARSVLAGQTGAVRDIVVLNAAAALVAFDGPSLDEAGFADQVRAGLDRVGEAIDSGAASALLDRWIEVSNAAASGR